ncbi:MAG: DUF2332 family protein [Elusimicrobia bacterium]|nr:DUF2332 family protein [Elusimicrobiota bacterium]
MSSPGPAEGKTHVPKGASFVMTKEAFLAQLERAALVTQGQPVTGAMVRHLAAELKRGDPAWWLKTGKAWQRRSFSAWNDAWGLLLAAIHFEALSDANNPLVRYFPSCGGTAEADPAPALARFLDNPPERFFERLAAGHRRPYVSERSTVWILGALGFFQRRRQLPFYLVEVNAGAGLDLAADAVLPQEGFDSELVAARVGLDPEPLSLSDIAHRRWLTAALPPEDMPAIEAMDQAADLVKDRISRDPAFVQLAACAPELAPKFVMKNIPPEADMGLLVFNAGATSRMSDERYAAYRGDMARLLEGWGARGLWIEVETVRGETYSTTVQVRMSRYLGGGLREFVAMTLDFAGAKLSCDNDALLSFLAV